MNTRARTLTPMGRAAHGRRGAWLTGATILAALSASCGDGSSNLDGTGAPGATAPPSRIAFVAQQNSVSYIFMMQVDAAGTGSDPVRLTSDAEAENYPS
jgi:hypothetical protein